jgi:hypothetical protein
MKTDSLKTLLNYFDTLTEDEVEEFIECTR